MNEILHILIHTLEHGLHILPFLYLAFLIIEYIEHKLSKKNLKLIKKSGKYSPLVGSALGLLPQCGFGVVVTNLYVTRIVSLGTLIAIYLSTSDEMLAILITQKVAISEIIKITATSNNDNSPISLFPIVLKTKIKKKYKTKVLIRTLIYISI